MRRHTRAIDPQASDASGPSGLVEQGWRRVALRSDLAARVGQSVFVSHSCPERSDVDCFDAAVLARPYTQRDLCEGGAAFRLVWGRDFRAVNAGAFAKAVNARCLIHGHEPCPIGYRIPNDKQIILDCCGEQAYCALLPTDRDLTHAQAVQCVVRLET